MVLIVAASLTARAAPVLWTADIALLDGGRITGSFIHDVDVGPFGTISDINLSTQGGSSGMGPYNYSGLIVYSPDFFIRVVPDSSLPDLTGQPVLTLAWVGAGGFTQYGISQGLSNAGGLLQAIGAREEICANADCTTIFGGPARLQAGFDGVLSGSLITPEPNSYALVAFGLCLFFAVTRKRTLGLSQ
jgi:hypothetical protein